MTKCGFSGLGQNISWLLAMATSCKTTFVIFTLKFLLESNKPDIIC